MKKEILMCAAGLLACLAWTGTVSAAEITGETIFAKESLRGVKVEQALAAADAAAEADFKQAKIRYLRAQLKARTRAMASLVAEEAVAKHDNDAAGLAVLAEKKQKMTGQVAAARQALEAEVGAPEEEESTPAVKPSSAPVKVGASPSGASVQPATGAAEPVNVSTQGPQEPPQEPPAVVIAPEDVPKLMLGKWKLMENGKLCGYYLLASSGQQRTYKAFRANGSPNLTAGGTWRVSNTGEVTLMGDMDEGRDTLRILLTDGQQGAGAHWVRANEGTPYRQGGKVEWLRESK